MADYNLSTNMSLPLPVVGQDPGPDWAYNLNASLNLIDGHNHAPGYGVPITPNGLNINGDLPMNSNNLTLTRTVRFTPQTSALTAASDVGCLYVLGVDLYYRDVNSNLVRVTQSGGIAGSPGSISNLVSPASAAYVAAQSRFVWQSAANTAADMDMGSAILRNLTSGSNGITLSAPVALAANYTLTLPAGPPASAKIMTMDNSGNIGVAYDVDNSTIEVSSNTMRVKDLGITTAKVADASITLAKLAAPTYQTAVSSGTVNVTNTFGAGTQTITGLSVTVTTTGRPLYIALVPEGSNGYIQSSRPDANPGANSQIIVDLRCAAWLYKNGSLWQGVSLGTRYEITPDNGTSVTTGASMFISPTEIGWYEFPTAGTYTYQIKASVVATGTTMQWLSVRMIAYELN